MVKSDEGLSEHEIIIGIKGAEVRLSFALKLVGIRTNYSASADVSVRYSRGDGEYILRNACLNDLVTFNLETILALHRVYQHEILRGCFTRKDSA